MAACREESAEQLAKEITARAAVPPRSTQAEKELQSLRQTLSASQAEAGEAKQGWAESERELELALTRLADSSAAVRTCERAAAAKAQTEQAPQPAPREEAAQKPVPSAQKMLERKLDDLLKQLAGAEEAGESHILEQAVSRSAQAFSAD
eukprot:COSAG04_NODE_12134_length_668_cov_1.084359_1_plen_150_part_00